MLRDKDKVLSWIDDKQNEIIDFLKKYVSYRSPSGEEEQVQMEFLKPFLNEKMDWNDVEVVDVSSSGSRPNLNMVLEGAGSGKNLLFNGHSDVVDVTEKEEEDWENDPWNPVIESEKMYGRGTTDMKGGITAFLWAIKAIMDCGLNLQGDVLASIVVGEERAEAEIGSIAATKEFLSRNIDIPFCINAEPTNNEIHTKSAGTFDFEISIPGKEVHTSQKNLMRYPQRYGIPNGREVGVDPVPLMGEVLTKLEELEHQWNMRYRDRVYGGGGHPNPDVQGVGPIAICNTLIRAGEYISSIPGEASIEGQIYYPPFVEDKQIWKEMVEVVKGVQSTSDWLKENPIEVKWKQKFDWPPYEVSIDHPGPETLARSVAEVSDRGPVYSAFKAVSDCTYIQKECDVDAISLGPGDLSMGAHGSDEYIVLDQLAEAAKIYAAMILNWCD